MKNCGYIMRMFVVVIIFLLPNHFMANSSQDQITSAVTYEFSQGRLGDNLIAYLHAKWFAYRYKLNLLYKPFPYSDQLMMHEIEQHQTSASNKNYKKITKFTSNSFFEIKPNGHLYVIPYFSECMEEYRAPDTGMHSMSIQRDVSPYFTVDWQDQKFIEMARQAIYPRGQIQVIIPPKDCISVALHVRKSSGFDDPLLQDIDESQYNPNIRYTDVGYPLKFVPDSYHIEQLQYIAKMFKGQKIYAFIFTDDQNPQQLASKYNQALNNDQIIIDYRKGENRHTINVLEDLFSMMQFDCLIRGDSNFAIIAARLGHFKVVISPLHHKWKSTKLMIDKVNIIINNNI